MTAVRVLVVGGYGLFGRRLVERLALRRELDVVVAGRSPARAGALVQRLAPRAAARLEATALDVMSPRLAGELRRIAPHVVVHTAGPFQGQDDRVARACIDAGVHYVDLADGREFVAGIAALDAAARAAGVAVISGASSVPALSGAAADDLARGLAAVTAIDIGISPGNRTERGLATVAAVLGYCGRPLPGGAHGWSGSWVHEYPAPVGRRRLSPCDVPDLALLPARYPGRPAVRFGAGLELWLLHRGMNLLAWTARRGWVADWSHHARWLWRAAALFEHLGSDAGAMHVRVDGVDDDGVAQSRRWQLVATHGDGPFVPTLAAAALIRKFGAGSWPAGARPCLGLLTLADFAAETTRLRIGMGESLPLFERLLGAAAYARLAPAVQRFHRLGGRHALNGRVRSAGAATLAGRLVARIVGAPPPADGAFRFELDASPDGETWRRVFPSRAMVSRLDGHGAHLVERLGPVRLTFALCEDGGALEMRLLGVRCAGVPCPRALLPTVAARETGDGVRLHFDVAAGMPFAGRLAAYEGEIVVPGAAR